MNSKKAMREACMNIAIFTNNYKPFIGGVPISIERLSDSLKEQGHKVYIFAPEYPEYEEEDGVIRVPLLKYLPTKNFDFPIANIFSREIERRFRSLNIDVVHIHHPFWMGKLGLSLSNKYEIPCIFTYHTRYEKYIHNMPFSTLISSTVIDSKVRRFMERCDEIIAPSSCIKKYLNGLSEESSVNIVPTGLSEMAVSKDDDKVREIKSRYCEDGELLLCSVARLTEEKNLYTLITNLKRLKDITNTKFKCIIIGNGPEKDRLEYLIKYYELEETVMLIGTVKQQEIGSYYKASDLFVFNSLSETQGLVVAEAMINETPVVALDATGVRDVVVDDKNGYLAKDNNEFVAYCSMVLEDEELLKRLARESLVTARRLTSDSLAKKMVKVYNRAYKREVTRWTRVLSYLR